MGRLRQHGHFRLLLLSVLLSQPWWLARLGLSSSKCAAFVNFNRDSATAGRARPASKAAKGGGNCEEVGFIHACVAAAIVQGKDDVARELVEQGAPLEDRGARQMTALHFAAEKGDVDMVQLLVEKGAKLEARDQAGRSVLTVAAIGGTVEVVQFLIKQGAKLESRDRGQMTPLLWASRQGEANVVRCLANAGADIAAVDDSNMTALQLAAVFNKLEVVRFLVDSGVDPQPAVKLVTRFRSMCAETADFLDSQV
mmetsp:Transcript_71950/g.166569  ORF Transcript_71950/g.166569 Transcript_71950/m.166569 type:complete len:254 (+) Transcript_71950:53-814(+)|eukprot:CAMPEP_0171061334 /NCGR_PEP_ID=MMETSP0766_2-20121228/4375_1 /TAXON_ID=439317 /ORGANISM="Gambierdiscus australes, Strain CAWD 149" /LENGTH=253 /DNA_ID=CAMNT_0011517007 /DNA_START=38 /DNA_END=799 /DNA_ORIENTATION=-